MPAVRAENASRHGHRFAPDLENGSSINGSPAVSLLSAATDLVKSPTRAISRPGAHAIFLAGVGNDFDVDLAESLIRVSLRIVSDGVAVAQILADGFERFHLPLPGFGEIGFAAGTRGDALEYGAGHGILIHVVGGDDVDRDAFVFGNRADVVGRHHAGIVRAI